MIKHLAKALDAGEKHAVQIMAAPGFNRPHKRVGVFFPPVRRTEVQGSSVYKDHRHGPA
jgi:hypothetical protein